MLPERMIPKAHMAQVHLADVEVHTDIMPLEGGAEPVAAFRLHKPVFPLPVTAQLPTVVTARKVKTPTTAQTALRTDIYSGGGVIKKIRLYLNVLTAQVSADEQQGRKKQPVHNSIIHSSQDVRSGFNIVKSRVLPSTFFILSFTKEVIQKSNYNIFYVKIKPEFPQYSPFYLEILLKERKNRNKIIFYYTYGLSWEKKQKKWVNVKNGLFITFKLFLIIKSFIII